VSRIADKKLANEASAAELRELDLLLQQNPHLKTSLMLMFDWWQDEQQDTQANSYLLFGRILQKIKQAEDRAEAPTMRVQPPMPDYSTFNKPVNRSFLINTGMIKNYFKVAFRQLQKQKMYAAIKIGGFAFSIAACLLIGLYIKDELSFDKNYPDADRIYRVVGTYNMDEMHVKGVSWPAVMAKTLKNDYPEVEKAGRLMPNTLFWGAGSNEVKRADGVENTHEDGFAYADQSLLEILKVPMVYGDLAHALTEPQSMVISKSKADKYFPGQNPVGKVMYMNNNKSRPYKIGAVMQDLPPTTHLHYNFLLTLTGYQLWDGEQENWGASNYSVYVLLRPGANIAALNKKITDGIIKNYYVPNMRKAGNKNAERIVSALTMQLQNIKDINLYSYDIHDWTPNGDARFVWLFGAISIFILIIACINFINLATAKSANRAKEVGLRKVVGSQRSGLIHQFLTESLLYSFLSFVLGLLLAAFLLPYFNVLAGKALNVPWQQLWFFPAVIAAAVVVGLLAGIYPAFYLSSFKPVDVLKGKLAAGSKSSVLRNGLVVFQFTTSIILIISTVVIYNQMHYILNKKVGFEKDQVLMIQGTNTLEGEVQSFKNELQKLAAVKSVSVSDFLPVSGTKRNGNSFHNAGKEKLEEGIPGQSWEVDADYIKTLGMTIVAGRDFNAALKTDSQAVIINQTMARQLGLKNPIGKRITTYGAPAPIIGVVKDFNFESLKTSTQPMAMHLGNSPTIVSVKIKTADVKATLAQITSVWKSFSPNQPIRYTFMDEQFANMYADVQRMGNIFTSFAVLAIIIACLGLFALAAFMAEQRSREIGIRKVLGASIASITRLLSLDFIKLVFIAILIASPIAWWAMNKWLQDFNPANRISISWWMFALAGITAIIIAVCTVSYQSIKAALMNPVKSLKAE
jgi:putative ABC transport system permease protein